jgi:hypothetical protein
MGDHSRSIDPQNTVTLPAHHEVSFGISISFTFRPLASNTSLVAVDPEGKLLISAAGADFIEKVCCLIRRRENWGWQAGGFHLQACSPHSLLS